jgi:excisionase family DNA binding protein
MENEKGKVQRTEGNAIVITIPFYEFEEVIREWIKECQNNAPNIQQDNQKKYLTRKEAASALHVSLVTLGSYIKAGILPAKQIGTRVLIPEESLHDALKSVPSKSRVFNS